MAEKVRRRQSGEMMFGGNAKGSRFEKEVMLARRVELGEMDELIAEDRLNGAEYFPDVADNGATDYDPRDVNNRTKIRSELNAAARSLRTRPDMPNSRGRRNRAS